MGGKGVELKLQIAIGKHGNPLETGDAFLCIDIQEDKRFLKIVCPLVFVCCNLRKGAKSAKLRERKWKIVARESQLI